MMKVAAFYCFFPMEPSLIEERKDLLTSWAKELHIHGLIILATEGINGTLSGREDDLHIFFQRLSPWVAGTSGEYVQGFPNLKLSPANRHVFRKFSVKVRDEIVTTTSPDLSPLKLTQNRQSHLSPKEWHEVLNGPQEDFVLIDTRNWYETKIGTFRGAIDPKIEEFTEFKDFFVKQELPKDKKILIFCTGGIRCEKGILELEEEGYSNVFQLEGGILNYLKHYPQGAFEGECFVFDQRVAVQPNLEPSQTYGLCPHCGQPAKQDIQCVRCDGLAKVCDECLTQASASAETCSKNCAHHWTLRPGQKGPRQKRTYQKLQVRALKEA